MSEHAPDSPMDFAAFVEWRRSLRAARADLIDVAETRIAHGAFDPTQWDIKPYRAATGGRAT